MKKTKTIVAAFGLLTTAVAYASLTGTKDATAEDEIAACTSAKNYASTEAEYNRLHEKNLNNGKDFTVTISSCQCAELKTTKWWKCMVSWSLQARS